MVDAYLERNPVRAILDSGAGVSIVGKRFVALYGQTFGHPPPLEPIALTITGVNSAAAGGDSRNIFPAQFRFTSQTSQSERGCGTGMGWRDTAGVAHPQVTWHYIRPGRGRNPSAGKICPTGSGMRVGWAMLGRGGPRDENDGSDRRCSDGEETSIPAQRVA